MIAPAGNVSVGVPALGSTIHSEPGPASATRVPPVELDLDLRLGVHRDDVAVLEGDAGAYLIEGGAAQQQRAGIGERDDALRVGDRSKQDRTGTAREAGIA